ncbi:MAG: hypothetical protein AB7F28_04845 [Candidatus Margulisiibacteriota bacterium]
MKQFMMILALMCAFSLPVFPQLLGSPTQDMDIQRLDDARVQGLQTVLKLNQDQVNRLMDYRARIFRIFKARSDQFNEKQAEVNTLLRESELDLTRIATLKGELAATARDLQTAKLDYLMIVRQTISGDQYTALLSDMKVPTPSPVVTPNVTTPSIQPALQKKP